MKKRIIITALVLAGVHLTLAIGSVLIAFGSGMEAFENPDYQRSSIERGADTLAGILMQPGISLWTPWMSKHIPDIAQWVLCAANSLLWGAVASLILHIQVLTKRKKPDSRNNK